ncbi:MAG: DNA-binding protein [Thermoprotei archaeon]|nr:MAG: DNA-binding protein [Thermoprotei archaeon]
MDNCFERGDYVLMSVKPVFANEILSGTKKYELRSKGQRIETGDVVIVYASAPVKSIVGLFRVGEVFIVEYPELVRLFQRGVLRGVTERDIQFMYGKKRPILVLEVVEPKRIATPITLAELREIMPGFRPPINYLRISRENPIAKEVMKRFCCI